MQRRRATSSPRRAGRTLAQCAFDFEWSISSCEPPPAFCEKVRRDAPKCSLRNRGGSPTLALSRYAMARISGGVDGSGEDGDEEGSVGDGRGERDWEELRAGARARAPARSSSQSRSPRPSPTLPSSSPSSPLPSTPP